MTTYSTDLVSSNSAFTGPGGGVVYVREAVYTLTAALVEADVIKMVPVAAGERVVDLQLISEDLDTHVSPTITLDVGDGVDTDRYIDGSTVAQTGGFERFGAGLATDAEAIAANYKYTEADTIDVIVSAAVATGATTGTIRVRAFLVRG